MNGKFEGRGVFTTGTGKKYEGEFCSGKRIKEFLIDFQSNDGTTTNNVKSVLTPELNDSKDDEDVVGGIIVQDDNEIETIDEIIQN